SSGQIVTSASASVGSDNRTYYLGSQGHCELAAAEYPTTLSQVIGSSPFPKGKATGDPGWVPAIAFSGVSFQRSGIGSAAIKDGTTHTYLIGEKYVSSDHYDDGADGGDNDTLYSGFGNDNYRSTYDTPLNDQRGKSADCIFGGPHSGIVQMS